MEIDEWVHSGLYPDRVFFYWLEAWTQAWIIDEYVKVSNARLEGVTATAILEGMASPPSGRYQ